VLAGEAACVEGGDGLRLVCIRCAKAAEVSEPTMRCACGGLRQVEAKWQAPREKWDQRPLGVWRYREMLPAPSTGDLVTLAEGGTGLHEAPRLAKWAGVSGLWVKNEGENPTGSFKDRGMTAAVTMARSFGHHVVGCASTGNTAASMAAYAARAGMQAVVLVPAGNIALGKLAQSLVHGAQVIAVRGSFDAALEVIDELAQDGALYLLNSVNPLRLEGQKTLVWEVLDQLRAAHENPPDVVVYPVGNAGNISAAHKALMEWHKAGLIDKLPRLIGVQAEGASPMVRFFEAGGSFEGGPEFQSEPDPETIATAIRIGNPVSWPKAIQAVRSTGGTMITVTDQEIQEAQGLLAAREGLFVEPASAASVAGLRLLVERGDVGPDERVVAVATGNGLKDTAGVLERLSVSLVEVEPTVDAVREALPKKEKRATPSLGPRS
jgi:threonine synthase